MTATSLPGTSGSHSASTNSGRSSRSGLNSTNSAPRARAARRWSRTSCRLDAARADHGVLDRHAAEADDELGVLARAPASRRPVRGTSPHRPTTCGMITDARRAVGVARADVAAEAVEEPVELALGVVETAGASPAVRAAVDASPPWPSNTRRARRRAARSPSPSRPARTARRRAASSGRGPVEPTRADHRLRDPRADGGGRRRCCRAAARDRDRADRDGRGDVPSATSASKAPQWDECGTNAPAMPARVSEPADDGAGPVAWAKPRSRFVSEGFRSTAPSPTPASSPDISDGFTGDCSQVSAASSGYDDAKAGTSRVGRLLRTMGSSRMKSTITVASRAQAPAA